MRNYEMISILNPELTEENKKSAIQKTEEIIDKFKGEVFSVDEWGKKRLAYPIQKFAEGYYLQLNFAGPYEMIQELKRVLRISEQVLRFQIIRVENPPEIDEENIQGTEEIKEGEDKIEETQEAKEEMEETKDVVEEEKKEVEAEEKSEESSEPDTDVEDKNA
jgi:small subunit ribosomal protein S6